MSGHKAKLPRKLNLTVNIYKNNNKINDICSSLTKTTKWLIKDHR